MALPSPRRKWIRRLHRLHAGLSHVEAAAASVPMLAAAAEDWETPAIRDLIVPIWFHWTAIVLRGTFRKGPRRFKHVNVSLEGLLEDFSEDATVFMRMARPTELRIWLGRTPTVAVVQARIRRDQRRLTRASDALKKYADTVAHLQIRERKLTGRRLREGRQLARKTLDTYHRLLTRAPLPKTTRDRLVAAFKNQVASLTTRTH